MLTEDDDQLQYNGLRCILSLSSS